MKSAVYPAAKAGVLSSEESRSNEGKHNEDLAQAVSPTPGGIMSAMSGAVKTGLGVTVRITQDATSTVRNISSSCPHEA